MYNKCIRVKGIPVPKPRMTQRDKWQKRNCVMAYRAWADRLRTEATGSPKKYLDGSYNRISVFVFLPIPPSYSRAKRLRMQGTPHDKRPDADNILKAVLDALFENDSVVYQVEIAKYWSVEPEIEIFLGNDELPKV